MRNGIYIHKETDQLVRIERLCVHYLNSDEEYMLFSNGSEDSLLMELDEFKENFKHVSL